MIHPVQPSNVIDLASRRKAKSVPSLAAMVTPRLPDTSDTDHARLVGIVDEASRNLNARVKAGYRLEWVK